MAEDKLSRRKKTILWAAVGTPGIPAFMANTPAKEAASNLASWIELFGLPVPEFLTRVGIDEQVTQAALTFYGLLTTVGGLGLMKRSASGTKAVSKA